MSASLAADLSSHAGQGSDEQNAVQLCQEIPRLLVAIGPACVVPMRRNLSLGNHAGREGQTGSSGLSTEVDDLCISFGGISWTGCKHQHIRRISSENRKIAESNLDGLHLAFNSSKWKSPIIQPYNDRAVS